MQMSMKQQYKLTKSKIIQWIMAMVLVSVIIFIYNTRDTRHSSTNYIVENTEYMVNKMTLINSSETNPNKTIEAKYILLWTNTNNFPFIYFGKGNTVFVDRKCEWTNCYVTSDREYLGHYSEFDVVAFNGPQLMEVYNNEELPMHRHAHQKYVYANIEAAVNYPICSRIWDGFFNWTWTYKLDSDSMWGYFLVKNYSGTVIAPNLHVNWINVENMITDDEYEEELKITFETKNKAAAWFVSNCRTMGGREEYVTELRNYLNYYNLDVDVYGECGTFQCSKDLMDQCLQALERNYYFYLAFENAISEDYVTEKILHALHHFTVPVVYGGANYSRFMPPGSYLNARELGARALAQNMYEVIQDPEKYRKFFRWRNHYSFHFRHESPATDDYCRFCAMINDKTLTNTYTVYNNLSDWWTTEDSCTALKNSH